MRFVLISFLVIAVWPFQAHAGFIEDWEIGVLIDPGNADPENAAFRDPVSPFIDSHLLELLGSTASASYDFSWGPTGGVFDISADLQLAALPGVNRRMTAGGFIYINSPVPLLISGMSQLDYDLPADPMMTSTAVGVSRSDPPETLGGGLDSYSTAINGPQAGILTIDFEDVFIPPNENFFLHYSFRLSTNADVPAPSIATGVGSAHFEITAVPEPSTVFLGLAIATPFVLRRPKRRRIDTRKLGFHSKDKICE